MSSKMRIFAPVNIMGRTFHCSCMQKNPLCICQSNRFDSAVKKMIDDRLKGSMAKLLSSIADGPHGKT